ncbi:MAG TPA: DUF72 domain-containing protein, partial [Mycobacterium sp.]|nr:DUF72 domain-containing protein [Mycobacterium sp.]
MVVHIGTSGWTYKHWIGTLYEPGLPQRRWLTCYSAEFDTVELNGSFYRWPEEQSFAAWKQQLPPGFTMAVKASRGLTHYRRLRSPEVWLDRMEQGLRALGDACGPLLVQLHPEHSRDDARLDEFLAALPDWLTVAVEFRHPSWDDPQVYGIGITGLTSLLARRSLYCSKHANGKHSIARSFASDAGNIWFERLEHTWDDGKCTYCGASAKTLDRGRDLETHAY